MDQRELNLGICYRLYHFIMETLASQAMKTVTLGRSSHYDSSSTKVKITTRGFGANADKVVQPEIPCVEKNIPCRNSIDEKVVVVGDLPHAPKKMKPLRSILKADLWSSFTCQLLIQCDYILLSY
ncbi:uncharacterized protein [Glycine max]|uniref:uncharacterized protein isoform X1 n=1 Tax=Glycine max TaxID=3847 RepID=UPI001B357220|nr:uncharacterized protein LOC100784208 isoform X1 [Glycine max]